MITLTQRPADDGNKYRPPIPRRIGKRESAERVHQDFVGISAHPSRREAVTEFVQEDDAEHNTDGGEAVFEREAFVADAEDQDADEIDDQPRVRSHANAECGEQRDGAVEQRQQSVAAAGRWVAVNTGDLPSP